MNHLDQQPVPIAADTHVHVYPCHDLDTALSTGLRNLDRLAGPHRPDQLVRMLFLTERQDCRVFRELVQGHTRFRDPRFTLEGPFESAALRVHLDDQPALYLFAGRQVVTCERVEVLALTTDDVIPDGQPLPAVLQRIRACGGIPVLSWAPGKWFFKRGRLVRQVLTTCRPGDLLVGDTTLRPTVWPEPRLLRKAAKRGIRVVAGSDPLPFPGEEACVGQYGIVGEALFDPERPVSSAREMWYHRETTFALKGHRDPLGKVLERLKKNRESKKAG